MNISSIFASPDGEPGGRLSGYGIVTERDVLHSIGAGEDPDVVAAQVLAAADAFGSPWLSRVDSSATTPLPDAIASETSADTRSGRGVIPGILPNGGSGRGEEVRCVLA